MTDRTGAHAAEASFRQDVASTTAASSRLSRRQTSLYAFGDIADSVKNVALAQFLLYYLTVVCGLSGSLAGAALFIALVAMALGLLFSLPTFDSQWALFVYVTCVLMTLRIAFSAFVLPYAAMTAELSSDYAERSVIMTYRNFFNISTSAPTSPP